MWRAPIDVSTESGPRMGRSGDSPVMEGASPGLAVNRERTWSGWLVNVGPPGMIARIRNTSPSRRREPKTNSIWRWVKRSTCAARGRSTRGGSASVAASRASIGPASDGSASPISSSAGGAVVSTTMGNSLLHGLVSRSDNRQPAPAGSRGAGGVSSVHPDSGGQAAVASEPPQRDAREPDPHELRLRGGDGEPGAPEDGPSPASSQGDLPAAGPVAPYRAAQPYRHPPSLDFCR